jgi:hypothetical protein
MGTNIFITIYIPNSFIVNILLREGKLESLRTGHVKIIGYQFGTKFKLVFCVKYDRGLDLDFWEILKP